MNRRCTAELVEFIGPEKDVPAPDMNTNEQTMAWMMDTYSMHMRQTVTAVVTGKPINIGGSRGRREATGRGIMIVCDEAVKKLRLNPESTRVIVQGFGNVGSTAASLMTEAATVIGIVEVDGGLVNRTESTEALWEYRQRNGTIHGFPGARRGPRKLLVSECEILIPAATENQITSRNADRIKCKILAEAPTVRLPRPPTIFWPISASSSFPTFCATPAALPPRTSSGCRTARATSGKSPWSTSNSSTS